MLSFAFYYEDEKMKDIEINGKHLVAAVFVLLLLGTGGLSLKVIEPNTKAVAVRFGSITGVYNSGIYFMPFTKLYKYDLRIRNVDILLEGKNSAVDKTGQDVYSEISINYRIKTDNDNIYNLYSKVGSDSVVYDVLNIESIIKEGFKQATVKYEALEILEKRQEVKELAKENIKSNFPTEYLDIIEIIISNIAFSDGFSNAIEEKKIAEQLALKEQNNLEIVKFRQQQEIEKYKAEAEKLRLQKQEVSALLNQRQWIEKWNGELPKYIISSQNTADMLLQLPMISDAEIS